jgi:hypothetical protein
MEKYVSHKEALEKTIGIVLELMESTRNTDAVESLRGALLNLSSVRSHLNGDYIQHTDPALFVSVNGTKVRI